MKQKILIIEDEPGISLPVKDELESEGFQVQVAEDGPTGLRSALEDFPDLVVLDLMLPGINGLDICRELRQKQIDIPIIMLTAKSQEIDRVVGLEIGADDYVTKPFSLRELLARVRVRLRNHSQNRRDARSRVSTGGSNWLPEHLYDVVGRTVSHYRVFEKLGSGGMGVVYKAEDLRLERIVALKFLRFPVETPELVSPQSRKGPSVETRYSASLQERERARQRQRFIHEAKFASALDHPHIGTIYEIDEADDGQLFIAMAYYKGETLKEKIHRGPLPQQEAIEVAIQVAEGLAAAHMRGIVHRDIKPSNLIHTAEGVVKILDFGLAKPADVTGLTLTGAIIGTPAYISPEQARGDTVDHRTDIWSLGVVLYEMLTGQRPFDSDSGQAVLYSILSKRPPPLSDLRPEVPERLEQVVERALAKCPSARYDKMDDMLTDLRSVLDLGRFVRDA